MRERVIQALEASLQAGKAILAVYASGTRVELKQDSSPLTQADRDAHRVIAQVLEATGLPLLSEEGQAIPFGQRKDWGDFWLVDPLDGTKEFLQRNGEFTVNVALVREGRPVLGVVFAPALQQLYFGAEGLGAFKAPQVPEPREAAGLLASSQSLPQPGKGGNGRTRVVASRSHLSAETKAFIEGLPGPLDLVSSGSSLKFCRLAEGEADLYPRFAPTMEWDTAAGQAVLEAAAGSVLDAATGKPLHYNKQDLRNPFFVARGAGMARGT